MPLTGCKAKVSFRFFTTPVTTGTPEVPADDMHFGCFCFPDGTMRYNRIFGEN